MPHLLLVDDDPEALEWLSELAKAEGFSVAQADSLRAARIHMSRLQPDILLTDLQLPDGKGVDLVADLEQRESTEVVMITGHASVESAVEALRLGATDYMVKPVDVERLKAILRRVPRTGELRQEIGELRDELRKLGRFGHILGSSAPMQKLYDALGRVAPTSATVLITGESGTGKELAAQTIHDLSRRKKSPFLPLNCGAVSPQLIESELFGHEKGSFTGADRQHKGYFERAHGGTLFLDEITEMDLYHRLNVFPIAMPPLRDRGTDIELLAQHFLEVLNRQESASKSFAPATIAALYAHSWPGNVRELKNYVQRAFILADDVIDANLAPAAVAAPESAPLLSVRVGTTLDEVSRRLIEATLAECGSKRKAADMLGISLKTLYNRLAAYKSESEEDEGEEERERHAA
jgi:two-component system response regulator AtoC